MTLEFDTNAVNRFTTACAKVQKEATAGPAAQSGIGQPTLSLCKQGDASKSNVHLALDNVNKTDDPGYAEAQQRIGTEMGRLPVFIGRYIGPVIKLILLASIVVDTGYLLYEYRVKTHVIPFLSSRFTTHRVNGSPRDCENGSWWFHPSGSGHQPWQHILQEEIAFPIAYTIMAFERPDQVWRLLRAIYRPHNFYCVHFDQKSPLLYKNLPFLHVGAGGGLGLHACSLAIAEEECDE
ncbi:unnamed protein product [Mesocestoides corti]|uniref:Uncharacterized protein n=1 Tax=Mesocestoides corti TaxID=53468 RepID=A0A0R3U803_MESCO|nr:unnamed protein product [Mesocestoides corti]